jgi:hypothetical protein
MGASLKSPENPHFPSPLSTKRASVRNLFGEADISDFGILSAFWLTQQGHLRGKVGISSGSQATLGYCDIARRHAQINSPPPLQGKLSESPSTDARLVNAPGERVNAKRERVTA